MPSTTSPVIRHLAVAQGLSIAGSSVDLTLTGIVGARIAPAPALATLPFSVIFLAAGLTTFAVSRAISRFGHRRVFTAVAAAAAVSGCVSAAAIQLGLFWLFCAGTALIGVYQAGSGYYRYLAADSTPEARPRAVATVLAGGLVAAIVGPFAATALKDATPTPYVASYLLVAALGTAAAVWNSRLRVPAVPGERAGTVAAGEPRGLARLWRQPALLLGVASAVLASGTMLSMMTAGPILGMAVGHTSAEAALAIQLHMVGMYVPGFFAARVMARVGGRRIALTGAAVIVVAGLAAAMSDALPVYLLSMFAIGVGWNFAYGGGSALIASSYEPAERGRVQPVAEMLIIAAQVAGSLSAAAFTTAAGWRALGWGCVILAAAVAVFLALGRLRRRSAEALSPSGRPGPVLASGRPGRENRGMTERLEVQRAIAAPAAEIFAVLTSPRGHVAIDSSGMLMEASGDPVAGVGDSFVVHMDREALNDYPLGLYDVTVEIVEFEPDREIAWTIRGQLELGHVYGYRLAPIPEGTLATSYCDWSGATQEWKDAAIFPVIPESALRATLGILARTVAPGKSRPALPAG